MSVEPPQRNGDCLRNGLYFDVLVARLFRRLSMKLHVDVSLAGMRASKKTILVFYNARQGVPLRAANLAHLLCWGRYSKHRVVYVNVAYAVPWTLLDRIKIDAIIFDTIFLSMHWSPAYFIERSALVLRVRGLNCPKIAVVQDEFINTDYVVDFLKAIDVTDVLSCATAADWPTIYAGLDPSRVRFRTVFAGYVDETRLKRLIGNPSRSIDIGYRAWANPFWLGEHGRKKVRIGEVFKPRAEERGFRIDINNPASTDFLIGDDWFEFLRRCRCVLGVEGGASVLDRDGTIKERVEKYLSVYPDATFEEVREECFAKDEWSINLAALSPRHFEAAMTRTCQILLEGEFNGVLLPWRHYIPVKSDFSNLDRVLDVVADDRKVREIAEQAYIDLIESGRWSYRAFVSEMEQSIIDVLPPPPARSVGSVVAVKCAVLYERGCWFLAHFESSPFGRRVFSLASKTHSLSMRIRRIPRRVLSLTCKMSAHLARIMGVSK
jgi:hypothetical protein